MYYTSYTVYQGSEGKVIVRYIRHFAGGGGSPGRKSSLKVRPESSIFFLTEFAYIGIWQLPIKSGNQQALDHGCYGL